MLTQQQAFAAETVSDTIAKILKGEPDWTSLSAVVPASLRRVVERCLQKDARRRFHDAADVGLELEETLAPALSTAVERQAARPFRSFFFVVLFVAGLILGIVGALRYARSDSRERSWSGTLLSGPSTAMMPRVSPNGQMLAFATLIDGQSQVAVMNPRSGNWTVLTHGDSGGDNNISWSPDNGKIYFDRMDAGPGGVFSVPALGGDTRLVLEAASDPVPLPDGSLVVVRLNAEREAQLYRFKPETADLQPLNAALPGAYGAAVRAFPDGRELVFYGRPANAASTNTPYSLHVLSLETRQYDAFRRLLKPASPTSE
jgi:hypothetical protein